MLFRPTSISPSYSAFSTAIVGCNAIPTYEADFRIADLEIRKII